LVPMIPESVKVPGPISEPLVTLYLNIICPLILQDVIVNYFGMGIYFRTANRAVQTAFTNACIQKISVWLLCADSLRHATDISTEVGRYNWGFCNSWQKSYGDLRGLADELAELKEKRVVPKKESLDRYRERKADQLKLKENGRTSNMYYLFLVKI